MIHTISDEHYFHKKMLKYCDRPFKDLNSEHKEFIRRHNQVVSPLDHTIHVGDIAMVGINGASRLKKIIEKLNGTHELVLGNHDEIKPFTYINEAGIMAVHTSLVIDYKGKKFVFAHDPAIWTAIPREQNIIFVCGHIHKLFKVLRKEQVVNVSADVWDYTPITLDTIIDALKE